MGRESARALGESLRKRRQDCDLQPKNACLRLELKRPMVILHGISALGVVISFTLLILSTLLIVAPKWRAKAKQVAKLSALGLVLCLFALALTTPGDDRMVILSGLFAMGVAISLSLLIPSSFLIVVPKLRARSKQVAKTSALGFVLCLIAIMITYPTKQTTSQTEAANANSGINATKQKSSDTEAASANATASTTGPRISETEAASPSATASTIARDTVAIADKKDDTPAHDTAHTPTASGEQNSSSKTATHNIGRAKLCLVNEGVDFAKRNEIAIPATSIFSNSLEQRATSPGDPTQSEKAAAPSDQATGSASVSHASFLTTSAVVLTKAKPCAETDVKLYVGQGATAERALASDNWIFYLDGIVDYPIPDKKPVVELGQLIDAMGVSAVLLTDASEVVRAPNDPDNTAGAKQCLQAAVDLANNMGAHIGRQTSSIVTVEASGTISSIAVGCPKLGMESIDLTVSWDKHARPASDAVQFFTKAGEYLTGAKSQELGQELAKCVDQALKPASHEISNREFRGAKIDCQAFARDGGGGSATLYRRFGALPAHNHVPLTPEQIAANPVLTPPDPEACKTDWSRCSDNSELINNYHDIAKAQVACKSEANERARFGTPEWPWFAFSSFRRGSDAPHTGIVTVIETDAKFSNQFGAMHHVSIICQYDLKTRTVSSLNIEGR